MKKDVIYIDIEDDITAIIDKVKHAGSPIVALVPPKRVGVLQSSVNLKLLQRAADSSDKRIVLITSDPALVALAGGLSLPIAKNLQSKPEISESIASDAGDGETINGEELAANELEAKTNLVDISGLELEKDNDSKNELKPSKSRQQDASKTIPNFDIFRKKLLIFSTLGVLGVGFLVWALVFAPYATISITARTDAINISKTLQLRANTPVDATQGIVPVFTQQVKKTISIDFTPTGQQNVGDKATGTVKFVPTSPNAIQNGATIPAGTQLSAGNLSFVTTAAAVIAETSFADFLNGKTASATAPATAAQPGTAHNGVSGALSGEPTGVDASFSSPTSGGSDKTALVVSADDVTKATAQLQAQDANTVKSDLTKQFSSDQMVIGDAYTVEPGAVASIPAVGQQATSAKLTQETTYTLLGVSKSDIKLVYDAYLSTQIKGNASQKIYASGESTTQFSSFAKVDGGYSVKAIATAQVGPNIDSNKVASDARGKMIGEVKQSLESIQGVHGVDVKLSPFWVSRVPSDANSIKVTFVLKND